MRCLVLLVSLILAACTTVDPYTGEQKTSNTAKGAGIGAIAGAVVGAVAADDRKKGAATGAVAGAAVGAGVGYYMDQQEAALRARLQNTGVGVQREGDYIRLIMPGDVTFDVDSYAIKPEFFSVLNSVSIVLVEFDRTRVQISGHTDSTGTLDYNQILSERRAYSVRTYLQQQQVAPARLQALGYGPSMPVASNDTVSGRRANRRVEIQLAPL